MYYTDEAQIRAGRSGSYYMGLAALVVFMLVLATSFIPGAPVAMAIGHEFGTAKARFPLRLPFSRPIFLGKGEAVDISYITTVRAGVVAVDYTFSTQLMSFILGREADRAASMRMNARGTTRFVAQREGFYFFGIYAEPNSRSIEKCTSPFEDFWGGLVAEHRPCPIYNASYAIAIRTVPGS